MLLHGLDSGVRRPAGAFRTASFSDLEIGARLLPTQTGATRVLAIAFHSSKRARIAGESKWHDEISTTSTDNRETGDRRPVHDLNYNNPAMRDTGALIVIALPDQSDQGGLVSRSYPGATAQCGWLFMAH